MTNSADYWMPVIIATIFGFILAYIVYRFLKKRALLKNGIYTKAKLISINKTLVTVGSNDYNQRPVMEMLLSIETAGTAYRQVKIRQAIDTPMKIPKPGDELCIVIDPGNPDKAILAPDQSQCN